MAFLGGTDNSGNPWRSRSTNSRLGFHAFHAVPAQGWAGIAKPMMSPDEVQQVVADILEYAITVNAPMGLIIEAFRHPHDRMLWLSQKDICALGIRLWSVEFDTFVCNR